MSEEQKYEVVASYTIQSVVYENGKPGIRRICDGFKGYEVLGLLEQAAFDVKLQLTGSEAIRRIVIRDKEGSK